METCSCEKSFLKTKIGVLEILCCDEGVHSVHILPFSCDNSNDLAISNSGEGKNAMNFVISWLESYFASSMENIKQIPPVCSTIFSNKGDFTVRVWKTLMAEVSFGQTISYSQLAALSGNSAASRAVGSAMKNNCIPLIIPCHRVIRSNGQIGHFSCGKNIKELLLRHEKISFEV